MVTIQPSITKQEVEEKPKDLSNIRMILENEFKNFQKAYLNDAVILIGNTGCGKSTLLASMLVGPHNLELKSKGKQKYIDYKE